MTKKVKPMLAVEADLDSIRFPVFVDRKLDGIRALVKDGEVVSRSLKPIRNKHVQALFSHLEGYDGELIVGSPTASDVFQVTTSGVMSTEGEPDVTFHVFDKWDEEGDYWDRCDIIHDATHRSHFDGETLEHIQLDEHIKPTNPSLCQTKEQVLAVHEQYIEEGYEGTMLRSPEQPYKFGRSTKKSQHLLKLKNFVDDEFVVVGFKERMHNANELTTNALGYAERSGHAENKIPMGTLGSLILENGDDTFDCGTGFDDATRQWIWDNREDLEGKLVKVKYQTAGVKDKPRFPVFHEDNNFVGFRDPDDIS